MSPALAFIAFFSQAEAAPPPPSPPPGAQPQPGPAPAPDLRWSLGLALGGSYRMTPAATDVPPPFGFSLSTSAGWRYVRWGRLELGLAAGFSYQRFARTVRVNTLAAPGMEVPLEATRATTMGDFLASQTFTLDLGRARPWLGVGGGISLGDLSTPESRYEPGQFRRTVPVIQAGLGFHLEVAPQTDGGLRVEYVHGFAPAFDTDRGERLRVFGDRVAVRLEMQYRF